MKLKLMSIVLGVFLSASNALFATETAFNDNFSVKTPEGKMPMAHWAVVMAKDGKLGEIGKLGAKYVVPEVANEAGTYALYGGVGINDKNNMILLEIYENEDAYQKHVSSKGFLQYKKEREPLMKRLVILEAEPLALEQKNSGIGTIVYMNKFEINPSKLEEYKKLAVNEAKRAVKNEPGVMGMFFTAEKDNPNMIHIMTIFRYQISFDKYFASNEYMAFKEQYEPMLKSFHEVKCVPTKIIFTGKGNN